MKLWVDDIRTPPSDDWLWARSVNQAITAIKWYDRSFATDTIYISLDHDAGDFEADGGDYLRVLDWLEQAGIVDTGYFFHLHTMNSVGRENMERIIRKNGWRLLWIKNKLLKQWHIFLTIVRKLIYTFQRMNGQGTRCFQMSN